MAFDIGHASGGELGEGEIIARNGYTNGYVKGIIPKISIDII